MKSAMKKSMRCKSENDLCIVAVVGDGMKHSPGTSGRMFSALGKKWCECDGYCTGIFRTKYFSRNSTG